MYSYYLDLESFHPKYFKIDFFQQFLSSFSPYASIIITLDLVPMLFKDGEPLNYSMNNDPHQTMRSLLFCLHDSIIIGWDTGEKAKQFERKAASFFFLQYISYVFDSYFFFSFGFEYSRRVGNHAYAPSNQYDCHVNKRACTTGKEFWMVWVPVTVVRPIHQSI